jgi:hypothetical protein
MTIPIQIRRNLVLPLREAHSFFSLEIRFTAIASSYRLKICWIISSCFSQSLASNIDAVNPSKKALPGFLPGEGLL